MTSHLADLIKRNKTEKTLAKMINDNVIDHTKLNVKSNESKEKEDFKILPKPTTINSPKAASVSQTICYSPTDQIHESAEFSLTELKSNEKHSKFFQNRLSENANSKRNV